MTKEQIKQKIYELSKDSAGKRIFSQELKKDIVESINSFNTMKEAADYYGIIHQLLSKWKRQISGKVSARYVKYGKSGIRYNIPTKIEAAKAVIEDGRSMTEVAKAFGTTRITISKWVDDYKMGLYTLDNVIQITRKKMLSSEIILGKLEEAKKKVEDLKRQAKEALEREHQEKLKQLEELA